MSLLNMNIEKSATKKLPLRGQTEVLDVYRIPIQQLKYNVKNDRIATFITQYIDEHGDLPEEVNEFNNIIESFIVDSNDKAFNTTKDNIKELGQMEPAVVLSDGIVIDGNRRFTAMRQLFRGERDSEKFEYLEAVILDRETYGEKDIKRLELNLQHGVDSKVDYNPIERLVGIYRDLILIDEVTGGPVFTVSEYAKNAQMKENQVRKEIEVAKLLLEYLEFLHQPKKFYIARRQNIDGPLREVYSILNSRQIDEDDYDIKEFLFANLLCIKSDPTRTIRALRKPLEDIELREELLDTSDDILDEIDEVLSSEDVQKEISKTGNINIPRKIQENVIRLTEDGIEQGRLEDARNQPVEALRKAVNNIKQVDKYAIPHFDNEIKEEFENYLKEIEQYSNDLRKLIDSAN